MWVTEKPQLRAHADVAGIGDEIARVAHGERRLVAQSEPNFPGPGFRGGGEDENHRRHDDRPFTG